MKQLGQTFESDPSNRFLLGKSVTINDKGNKIAIAGDRWKLGTASNPDYIEYSKFSGFRSFERDEIYYALTMLQIYQIIIRIYTQMI